MPLHETNELNDEAEGEGYGDERGRVYRAAGGSKRCPMVRVIPHPSYRKSKRFFPFSDFRDMEITDAGDELIIDLPHLTLRITGRNLDAVAMALGSHACSRIEAFNAEKRDMPSSQDEPLIEAIEYKVPRRQPASKAAVPQPELAS